MKFTIDFNFEKVMLYIVFQSIFGYLVLKYDNFIDIFIKEIILLISMIISIICFCIRKKNTSNENKIIHNERYYKMEKDEKKIERNNGIKEYLYIIFFYFIFNIIPFINGIQIIRGISIFSVCTNFLFIGILLIGYLSSTILYKHQLMSGLVLFLVIFFHPNLSNNYTHKKHHIFFFSLIYSIIFYYLQGIFRGYYKYTMEVKFVDPYFISAVDAGMNMIKNLLVYLYHYLKKNKKFFKRKKNKEFTILKFIFGAIGNIGYPILDILNCYHNSPYHQCVAEYLAKLIQISFYKDSSKEDMIVGIINSIFSCISAEIIILRFCGLEENTKIAINERTIQEDNISVNLSHSDNSLS